MCTPECRKTKWGTQIKEHNRYLGQSRNFEHVYNQNHKKKRMGMG